MRVKMYPDPHNLGKGESGIRRVIEAYCKYLPEYGIEIAEKEEENYDITASHAGTYATPDVLHTHGLYWTGDYDAVRWEWSVNQDVINSIRHAKIVTVPSKWVQKTFARDMRFLPKVVPHGIDWWTWEHNEKNEKYVLWNKNRYADVCNPLAVKMLAYRFPRTLFVSTYAPPDSPPNVQQIGVKPHSEMKRIIQRAGVYLSSTKETFGIGVLEAMASGIPVLGFAHGGNLDIVRHGVTGYLAQPNNWDDLAEGLSYCMKHKTVLGRNALEEVRKFSWEEACKIVADVYEQSLKPEPPTVTVVIPTYNYAEKVGRAIESALEQTYPKHLTKIVIVNDGSTDGNDTDKAVSRYVNENDNVFYIKQNNQGVANARNNGIASTDTKYICCLDADDMIMPKFLEACIEELEGDRSLGIAYTGLWYIKPDGSEGLSTWPGEFDFDEHLKRKNQVPTCCVFRRLAWARVGGYNQRYAPGGAGSEDAEFFLRLGAYGWNAKKVTNAGLFVYSWMTGGVSGDREYVEMDWTELHPWTKDGLHPFASVAKPENDLSHPVHQYDSPQISVIIPVSRKHIKDVKNALDSLESQTFRNWEAIVVWDGHAAEQIDENTYLLEDEDIARISVAYPYVNFIWGGDKEKGAGYARNRGAEFAKAPMLMFLDADDWLYPQALELMLKAYQEGEEEAIIYSDYVGKAYMDKIDAYALGDRLLNYREDIKEAVVRFYSADYNCERALIQPQSPIYIWNLVSSLVPKRWHDEIGGFDKSMPSWEDWDYWLRMARAGKCFTRIPQELVVYRFYTGTRREAGIEHNETLLAYLRRKYEELTPMPCNCSGGRSNPTTSSRSRTVINPSTNIAQESRMSDDEIQKIVIRNNNRAQTKIVGEATGRFYGYLADGDEIYMHRADIARKPNVYVVVQSRREVVPPAPPAPPPEPVPMQPTDNEAEALEAAKRPITDNDLWEQPEDLITTSEALDGNLLMIDLLPGVTPAIAEQMREKGVLSAQDILDRGKQWLVDSISGIGPARAGAIIDFAQSSLSDEDSD